MKNNHDELLRRISLCLYVIIGLLTISLVINIINTSNVSKILDNNSNATNEEEETEYDVSSFESVDYDGFKDAIKSKEYTVVYIGRSTCGYCVEFLPTMKQAQTDYGFTTVYFDITQVFDFTTNPVSITDQKAYDGIVKLNSTFFEHLGETPMVAVFKNGQYVNGTIGYQSYNEYSEFIEECGIVKK